MNHQEYEHINYLAIDILIDAKINRLPINVVQIATKYQLEDKINISLSRFENAVNISSSILQKYGYDNRIFYSEFLASKMMSPLIIFKELEIESFEQFYVLSDLPPLIASLRYDLYNNLLKAHRIGKYNIETRLLLLFKDWISFIHRSS